MQKIIMSCLSLIFLLILGGCGSTLNDIKGAVSEIDTAADKAAKAISYDAQTIRSKEIEYNNVSFTINDLFETILRDVQWEYEEINDLHKFKVNGTWQDSLFDSYQFTEVQKKQLEEVGKVLIEFEFDNEQIVAESTSIQLILNQNILVEKNGEDALVYLFDYYTSL